MPAGGVQLADVIVPEVFTEYLGVNSMTSTALFRSGVLVPNQIMQADISRGGNSLNVPAWTDLVSPADPGGADPKGPAIGGRTVASCAASRYMTRRQSKIARFTASGCKDFTG